MKRLLTALLAALLLAYPAQVIQPAERFALPLETVIDSVGVPLAGAKLEFFEAGTTTPLDTFSDDTLTTANTNPVVANSAGRFGDIFLQAQDYRVVLSDANDVQIWTADPVRGVGPEISAFARTILDDASASAVRTTIDAQEDLITTRGDVIVGNSSGAASRLAIGASDTVLTSDGTDPSWSVVPLPTGYITPVTLTNAADADHDITVPITSARDVDDGGDIRLTSAITKQIDASFAEGDNQGGLDTGTVAADTTYFVWLIGKTDGTADVLFSLSKTAPTMPTGFTLKRLLAAVRTPSGAADIVASRFTYFNQGLPLDGLFLGEAQTYTSANVVYTWDHALGVVPREMIVTATCLIAQDGYNVGEVITFISAIGNGNGSTLAASSTQIFLTIDNGIFVVDRAAPAAATMTINGWEFRVAARG